MVCGRHWEPDIGERKVGVYVGATVVAGRSQATDKEQGTQECRDNGRPYLHPELGAPCGAHILQRQEEPGEGP